MPMLSTRGSFSSKNYAHIRPRKKISNVSVTGFVIFNHGATGTAYRTATRDHYDLATNVITTDQVAVPPLITSSCYQSAASASFAGFIANGYNGTDINLREKYVYASKSVLSSTPATQNCSYGAGVANNSVAIYHLGWDKSYSSKRDKLILSTEVCVPTGAASVASYDGSALGNLTEALFCVGGTSAGNTTTTNKFNYATELSSVGPTLTAVNIAGSAFSNGTLGLISIGYGRTTNLYTHATGTITTTTLLAINATNSTMGGNNTMAIITHAGTSVSTVVKTRSKFTFATKYVTAAQSGTIACWCGSAMYGAVTGVNS